MCRCRKVVSRIEWLATVVYATKPAPTARKYSHHTRHKTKHSLFKSLKIFPYLRIESGVPFLKNETRNNISSEADYEETRQTVFVFQLPMWAQKVDKQNVGILYLGNMEGCQLWGFMSLQSITCSNDDELNFPFTRLFEVLQRFTELMVEQFGSEK